MTLGLCAVLLGWPIAPAGLAAYLMLALVPGALVYRALADEPGMLETILAATTIGPVLTTAAATVLMLFGLDSRLTAMFLIISTGVLGVGLWWFAAADGKNTVWELRGSRMTVLLGFIGITCLVISIPAFANEWWRLRADAWFHGAVVYQILDYGIPPE
ncbi:MAG: hypothetical protein JSW50_04410, partial [Candidatus Latescibacterota bacterium]